MKPFMRATFLAILLLPGVAAAQSLDEVRDHLSMLAKVPAVTGHEQSLSSLIADQLKKSGLNPQIDFMSNVTVTLGSGTPHRMLVASLDEPGFIVSGITEEGYLRMQRIGTAKAFPYFDQYFEGQRLTIRTSNGKTLSGVLSIPSTHLTRGANRVEKPFDLVDGYIDIGVKSLAEASELGVKILDPISIEKGVTTLAQDHISGPFLSDRVGAAVLMSILMTTAKSQIKGTVTFAFTTQEHFGRKGLDRMTVAFEPDQVYVLEALNPSAPEDSVVSVDVQAAPAVRKMIEKFAGMREASLRAVPQSPQWKDGTEVVRLGIPIRFYATPVEVLDLKSVQSTIRFLRTIVLSGVS